MKVTEGYTAIKPKENLSKLDLICPHCTRFKDAAKSIILKKVGLRHDERNERFVCDVCHQVTPEKVVRYYLKLDLPEYVAYEDTKPVEQIVKEREEQEKFVIEAINQDSPLTKKKRAAKVARTPQH